MKRTLLALAVFAALSGCGEDDSGGGGTSPPDGPLLTFEKGGGVASMPLRLTVERDGSARVSVTAGPEQGERGFKLSADDMATVEDALAEAKGIDGPGTSGGCSDCFEYSVTADDIDFELDSVTYTDDATPVELVTLVAILDELAASG